MKYCSQCGSSVVLGIPPGDDRPRYTCNSCGTIHYQNPRVVVGCIPTWEAKILFCRRAIEPRYGNWTLPAGYLENGETAAEGARRETLEEACAAVAPTGSLRSLQYLLCQPDLSDVQGPLGRSEFQTRSGKFRCPALRRRGDSMGRSGLSGDRENIGALYQRSIPLRVPISHGGHRTAGTPCFPCMTGGVEPAPCRTVVKHLTPGPGVGVTLNERKQNREQS